MRTSAEMFTLFEKIAHSSDKIRVMTLEGSRVNSNVVPDIWQDYDITFLVTDVDGFKQSDEWLKVFGDIVFMQKPEAMDLFSPDLFEGWYSYLIKMAYVLSLFILRMRLFGFKSLVLHLLEIVQTNSFLYALM